MNILLRCSDHVSRWLAWFGGAALLLSAILISLDVIFRAAWKVTFFESFELSGYAFAIATTTGMSYALISKAHIRIELLYVKLPEKWRAWLDVWAYSAMAVVSSVLFYWCLQTVLGNILSGARSNSTLAIPLAWPQLPWLVGIAWLALVAAAYALFGLVKCLGSKHAEAHKRLGMASLEEEIDAEMSKGNN